MKQKLKDEIKKLIKKEKGVTNNKLLWSFILERQKLEAELKGYELGEKETLKKFSERLKRKLRKDAVPDIGGKDELPINYLEISLKIIDKIKKQMEEK